MNSGNVPTEKPTWKMYNLGVIPSVVFDDLQTIASYIRDALKDQKDMARRFLKIFIGHKVTREEIERMEIEFFGEIVTCEVFTPIENHAHVQAMVDFGWAHPSIILPTYLRAKEMETSLSLRNTLAKKYARGLPAGYKKTLYHRNVEGSWWSEDEVLTTLTIYQAAFPNYVEGQFTRDSVISQFHNNWNLVIRNPQNEIVAIASVDVHRMTNEHGCKINVADITEVAVASSERGKGFAHIMYETLLENLRAEKFDLVITECRAIAGIQAAAICSGMVFQGRLTAHIQCQSPVGDQHDACKYEDLYVYLVCLSR